MSDILSGGSLPRSCMPRPRDIEQELHRLQELVLSRIHSRPCVHWARHDQPRLQRDRVLDNERVTLRYLPLPDPEAKG